VTTVTEIAPLSKLAPCKREDPTKPPYLSFCLIVRNVTKQHVRDGHTITDTLRSIRERCRDAEIVVVDTQSSDETVALCAPWADVFDSYKGPKNEWTPEMYAFDNASAARQRSFDLSSGVWVCWADADDVVLGGAEAERYLRQNARWRASHGKRGYEVQVAQDVPGVDAPQEQAVSLEDVLRGIEEKHPDFTQLRCPYLYRRDEHGNAIDWQERERFHRLGPKDEQGRRQSVFRWAEAAHEICVAVDRMKLPPNGELPHLLWLHQKVWDAQESEFSIRRHGEIMLKDYEAGNRHHRRCHYLATYAPTLWPERELEFLEASLECSFTDIDRCEALIALGTYYHRRGLEWDSRGYYQAAIDMAGYIPDPYYAAGNAAMDQEDWIRAADCYKRGNACAYDANCTHVSPRDHAIHYPSREAYALREAGKMAAIQGHQQQALTLLDQARKLARAVFDKPEAQAVASDKIEAERLWLMAENECQHQSHAMTIYSAWELLRKNDEPEKALGLIHAFTWGSEDHPLRLAMEQWAIPILRHKTDPQAYAQFYAHDDKVTGYVQMPHEVLTYEHAQPRVKWIVDRVLQLAQERQKDPLAPVLRVLDLGCCDGQIGMPILLEAVAHGVSNYINYHGVDVNPSALEHFKGHLEHYKQPEVSLERGTLPSSVLGYDVIVVGEIVEHVADPADWMNEVSRYLAPGGEMLLTTPWGSFDMGVQPATTWFGTPRDDRGHLRAYSPREFVHDARDAELEVSQLVHIGRAHNEPNWYQALVARLKRRSLRRDRSVVLIAPGALWKWNGSKVDREGIGASEEMIVRMAEKLAQEGRRCDVFGPVPEEEVYNGVGYWRREGARELSHFSPSAKVVISRVPDYVFTLDQQLGYELPPERLVLWLQDTHYHSLNQTTAARYGTIVVVSEWHKKHTIAFHKLQGFEDRIKVAYNWADIGHFQPGIDNGWNGLKVPTHFLYASSPDRGLVRLLELWPQVLERIPEATLSVLYGWKGAAKLGAGTDQAWNQRYLTSRRRYEELRFQKGVRELGLVNHYQVAIECQRAGALAYPVHDFFETGCLAAVKAAAGGAIPVVAGLGALEHETGRYDALPSEWNQALDVNDGTGEWGSFASAQWLAALERSVSEPLATRQELAQEALRRFSWESQRKTWLEILS